MEWKISPEQVSYEDAMTAMESRVQGILDGTADELVWLLEHPPLYTAGTSATQGDLLQARFPVYQTGRGGQYTYHGPGQRVAYVMLDLNRRGRDVRVYVQQLEAWIIATLATFGIKGLVRDGRVGVWVEPTPQLQVESKIAAIGVRLRKWVTFHGMSLNISPDLSHYSGIIPCGIAQFGVTSMQALGKNATLAEVDEVLQKTFADIFFAPDNSIANEMGVL